MSVLSGSTGPGRPPARKRPDWLPRGTDLSDTGFPSRHRLIAWILAAHLPALLVLGPLADRSVGRTAAVTAVPALLTAAAFVGRLGRRVQAVLAAGGLLACSAGIAYLSGGQPEGHFHFFLAVAVIALYQDWIVYLVAVGLMLAQHVVLGTLDTEAAFGHGGNAWAYAAVHAGFLLVLAAVQVLFWHYSDQARDREWQLRSALDEGRTTLTSQLEETHRIRMDLIGTVSHEFRTPLTGIRAATLTLLKRGRRLDDASREQLLHAVLAQEERLSRLLENMLIAASAKAPDPHAVADVHQVATEVAMLAHAAHPRTPEVSVAIPPGTLARIDRQALHQVLANLVDNAQMHGAPTGVPLIAGGVDGNEAWFSVSNEGSDVDETMAAVLFEPFTQADTSATRAAEGIGMGLYVVRRLVEVHGGRLSLQSDDGWLTVEVRLPGVPSGSIDIEDRPAVRLG